jgi:hypothetical protein
VVPLPHGTEVLTRVERSSGGRHLAHGTLGRVVRERDGGFDVHVTGVERSGTRAMSSTSASAAGSVVESRC